MQRFIMNKLINWKNSKDRKPLILKGARQVGKTYILKEFGENNYDNVAYFNFDHDEGLAELFSNTKDPKRIIEQLSLANGKKINPNTTLIIFFSINISPFFYIISKSCKFQDKLSKYMFWMFLDNQILFCSCL